MEVQVKQKGMERENDHHRKEQPQLEPMVKSSRSRCCAEHFRHPTCPASLRYDSTKPPTCHIEAGATNAWRHLPESGRTWLGMVPVTE